ncbi:MAG TPA: glycosyltransferase [Terriglobia bacterium]|nr:glycosyltransferase [Terriglobia bacterium]
MKASVIIPVYNAVRHLELVLAGFGRQTFADFELIVADDGSGPEMRQFVDAFTQRSPFQMNYVFQPDEGFRKSRILNAAIRLAKTDYLVFSDGDCIPHRRFLEAHWAHREPRTILLGRRVKFGERISSQLTPDAVAAGALEKSPLRRLLGAMVSDGSHWDEGVYLRSAWLRKLISRKAPYMLGSTYSLEKSLVEEINGFNEEFVGYGGEDIEFECRLRLAGARFKWVRHQAIQYHLHHAQKVETPGNAELVQKSKALGRAACAKGLRSLETSEPAPKT